MQAHASCPSCLWTAVSNVLQPYAAGAQASSAADADRAAFSVSRATFSAAHRFLVLGSASFRGLFRGGGGLWFLHFEAAGVTESGIWLRHWRLAGRTAGVLKAQLRSAGRNLACANLNQSRHIENRGRPCQGRPSHHGHALNGCRGALRASPIATGGAPRAGIGCHATDRTRLHAPKLTLFGELNQPRPDQTAPRSDA